MKKKKKRLLTASMDDDDFITFQDAFYNLLEKYGVEEINCEHKKWNKICYLRDKVCEFIENEIS